MPKPAHNHIRSAKSTNTMKNTNFFATKSIRRILKKGFDTEKEECEVWEG